MVWHCSSICVCIGRDVSVKDTWEVGSITKDGVAGYRVFRASGERRECLGKTYKRLSDAQIVAEAMNGISEQTIKVLREAQSIQNEQQR